MTDRCFHATGRSSEAHPMGGTLRALLMRLGERKRRIVAVFGFTPAGCHAAVLHVRSGEPAVPIWLFSAAPPLPETAILCERVCVQRNPLSMLVQVGVMLWRCWVVLAVATWTGERGRWHLKLAPFLIPPFRALILNRHGGFFAGTPANVLLHIRRGLLDATHSGWNRGRDITAAILLRWCPWPHRRLFRSWHGSESLDIPHPPEGGDGLARVKVDRLYWNGPELEQLVQSTSARWILFQVDGADGHTVDDMLPLASDNDTFAVAREAGFREWKPQVFPMAPFRLLQPGEASQVLCPISDTILADRRKLAALGIPRTTLTGTAWMLLFWKAAAAGWRSYNIGDGARPRQQPDFPVQEKAFVLRALSDPALRRLGPREPALARGNCAFAPSYLASARIRKEQARVLLVSPFLPYPLSHGGAVRIFNLCRALASRVDFILVAQRESQDVVDYAKLHEVFREVHVVDRDEPPAADKHLPRQVRDHESRSLRALITDVCRRSKPDLLQIEYTHMAAFRDAAPGIPAILVEHDLTFTLYRQLAEANPSRTAWREYQRWLEFERHWLGVYDAVWTVSQEDFATAALEGGRAWPRTYTVPNGVDTTRYLPSEEAALGPEVFFVGSFRHLPNVLGFEVLRQQIMPRVWTRFPHARLRVVAGPDHLRYWCRHIRKAEPPALDPRIEFHGFVEDLRPFYARAAVVVAPLAISAGTNIKVLEALACGKAIVTTPAGCAGLGLTDGRDAIVCRKWPDFADAVSELFSNAAQRARIGYQGRRVAVDRFSWPAVAGCAYNSYLALLAGSAPLHQRFTLLSMLRAAARS